MRRRSRFPLQPEATFREVAVVVCAMRYNALQDQHHLFHDDMSFIIPSAMAFTSNVLELRNLVKLTNFSKKRGIMAFLQRYVSPWVRNHSERVGDCPGIHEVAEEGLVDLERLANGETR